MDIKEFAKAIKRLDKDEIINNRNKSNQSILNDLKSIKHPWQPDWLQTGKDMESFLKLLDEYRHLSKKKEDWYPPYIYIIDFVDNKETLSFFPSEWNGSYDPVSENVENPLKTIEKHLNTKN